MDTLPIIALDFDSTEKVESFLDQFDEPLFVKVGMEPVSYTHLTLPTSDLV